MVQLFLRHRDDLEPKDLDRKLYVFRKLVDRKVERNYPAVEVMCFIDGNLNPKPQRTAPLALLRHQKLNPSMLNIATSNKKSRI